MAYLVLTQDEQDDIMVAFMLAQERDQFTHGVNRQRYEAMLLTLNAGPFRDRINQLLSETNSRIVEVDAIVQHSFSQMPPSVRIAAAVARLKARGAL